MFKVKESSRAMGYSALIAALYLVGTGLSVAGSNAPLQEHVAHEFQCETTSIHLKGALGTSKTRAFAFEVQELRIGDRYVSSQDIERINAELAKPEVVFMRPYVWCDAKNPMVSFGFQRISENRAVNHSIAAFFHGSTLDEIVTK